MTTRWKRLGLGLLAGTAAMCAVGAEAATVVYHGFTLIDGSGTAPKADQAMVVDDAVITWVGPAKQVPRTPGAARVDLKRKYLMPGIVDLHIHIGTVRDLVQKEGYFTPDSVRKDLRTYAAFGVTTVQSMGTDKDSIIAIRDTGPAIEGFLRRNGDPYERIGDDKVSAVQLSLGSSGVPETFVIDGRGRIVQQHIGDIRAEDVPKILEALQAAQ